MITIFDSILKTSILLPDTDDLNAYAPAADVKTFENLSTVSISKKTIVEKSLSSCIRARNAVDEIQVNLLLFLYEICNF